MTGHLVDVVIPVHRVDRALGAAVASAQSVLQGVPTRVLVVLHNLKSPGAMISELAPTVAVLRCDDGIPSPSGPRNTGLAAATAPFVFFLDSDDVLAPGCLGRLHEVAVETGADVVLPSILGPGGYLGTPLVLSRAPRTLDVVRHGLFERSHSFALIRRRCLDELGLRFPEGIRTGQDLVLMARLYTDASTAIARDAVYVLKDHGGERVSTSSHGRSDQLAAVAHILSSDWIEGLPEDQRDALVRRILSVNLANGWRRKRGLGHRPSAADHASMRDLALQHSRRALQWMSVRDRVTLRFSESPTRVERMLLSPFFGLVPSTLIGALSRSGPLPTKALSWLVARRRRRTML